MNRKIAASLISVHPSKHPKYVWECYSPKKVFERKIQKGFKTKREAESYKLKLLDELGQEANPLTDELRLVAARYQSKLTVDQIEKALARETNSVGEGAETPLSYFCEELITEQQDAFDSDQIGVDQLKTAKRGRRLVKDLKDMPIGDVTEKMVKKWVAKKMKSGVSWRTCKNQLENLRRWCRMAVKEGMMDRDPLANYKMKDPGREEVQILKANEVAKLVLAAVRIRTRDGAAPALAWIMFGCFAGLRTSEIRRLTWEDIDLEGREILVKSRKTQRFDRSKRYVEILGPLYDYCKTFIENGHTGHVTGLAYKSERSFSKYQKGLQELAKVDVPHNACRHTFGSFHLKRYQKSEKTAFQMGHSELETLQVHYKEAVKKQSQEKFWAIGNPKEPKDKLLLITNKPGRPCKINDGAGERFFISV